MSSKDSRPSTLLAVIEAIQRRLIPLSQARLYAVDALV